MRLFSPFSETLYCTNFCDAISYLYVSQIPLANADYVTARKNNDNQGSIIDRTLPNIDALYSSPVTGQSSTPLVMLVPLLFATSFPVHYEYVGVAFDSFESTYTFTGSEDKCHTRAFNY